MHARQRWTKTTAALIAGAVLALSPWASAQQWRPNPSAAGTPSKAAQEEAKARYKRGIQLYQEEGQVEPALIELQRAYDLAPNYRVLYNIGQVARSLPDFATSLRAFERYLQDGGREVPASRRTEVEKEINELRERVATIMVTTNMEGATISIDDVPMGKSPLAEPLLANAGRRRISVAKDALTAQKVIIVAGRDNLRLDLPLEQPRPGEPSPPPTAQPGPAAPGDGSATTEPSPISPTPESGPTPTPDTAPRQPKTSYTWIGWVATGAFAVGTGVTGVLALSASSDLKDARYAGSTVPADISDTQSRAQTMAIVADVLAAATVVTLGVTLYFTLSGPSEPAPAPASSASATRTPKEPVLSSLRVGLGPGAVQLGGTF